ncbi:MAG TPA: acyl-CoA dehydrogenase family protein [Pseudomonadales bacterium]|nr:acyl-CoA dehydrogenase family protein [Pseudomonadales bacterium]
MEFGLSSEQTLLQDSVNRFVADNAPLDVVRKIAKGGETDAGTWQGLAELGIPGLMIPEASGGVGLSVVDAAIVAECLGYHVTPSPFISSAVIAPVALIEAGGHDDLLGAIATGRRRIGVAFSEAIGARADAGISASGDKISGKSLFVMDSDADDYLVASGEGHLYLVPAGAAKRSKLTTIDNTRSTCELVFDNARAQLVSDDISVFNKALDAGRVVLAADTLGAAQNMIDQAVAYARERVQFGRPIATFQAVKHMCAEMAADLEPCRAFIWYASYALGNIPEEARLTACHAKAHLAEVGKGIAKTATEVHGGMGFTDLLGLHFWFKRIGFNRQMLGAPELVREEAARIQGLAA